MTRIPRTLHVSSLAVASIGLLVIAGPLQAQSRYEVTHRLADTPASGLTQTTDGTVYGVTYSGGEGFGTVYRLTPEGPATVAAFTADMGFVSDGGQLLQASDGALYGTT